MKQRGEEIPRTRGICGTYHINGEGRTAQLVKNGRQYYLRLGNGQEVSVAPQTAEELIRAKGDRHAYMPTIYGCLGVMLLLITDPSYEELARGGRRGRR